MAPSSANGAQASASHMAPTDWTVIVQMTDMQGLAHGLETGKVTPKEAAEIIDLMLGVWQDSNWDRGRAETVLELDPESKTIKEKLFRLSKDFLKKEIAEGIHAASQERKEIIGKGD